MPYMAFSNKRDSVKPLQCVVDSWAGDSLTLKTQRSLQCLLAKETWWINMLLQLQFASPVNGIIRGISYNIKNLNLIFSALNSFSAISCPRLVSPSNGRFTSFPQTRYNSIVTVECNEGYFLIGQNVLRCVDNANDGIGDWDERIPTCRREIFIRFCCKNVKDFLISFCGQMARNKTSQVLFKIRTQPLDVHTFKLTARTASRVFYWTRWSLIRLLWTYYFIS